MTEFGITDCPECKKPVVVLVDDPDLEWQYLCPPCGKAFKFQFREDDDVEE